MNLERVAHRRLADAGRADGDDAVDHLFLALRRRGVGAVFCAAPRLLLSNGCSPWRQASAAAGAAGIASLAAVTCAGYSGLSRNSVRSPEGPRAEPRVGAKTRLKTGFSSFSDLYTS